MAADETPSEIRLRREREDKATQLAVDQARREERVSARLDSHEEDIRELRQTQASMSSAMSEMRMAVGRIETALAEQAAAAKAVAAKATQTVTTRQFYIGVALVVASLVGSIIGSGGHL